MQLSRNSSNKQGTNLSDFFYFNLLLHGIQDGFVTSFSKKMYLYFQLANLLRLFEVMQMIFKKCIRIIKGTSNLTSTLYTDFVIRRLYRYSY